MPDAESDAPLAHVHATAPDGSWWFLGTIRGDQRVRVTLESGHEVFVSTTGKVAGTALHTRPVPPAGVEADRD